MKERPNVEVTGAARLYRVAPRVDCRVGLSVLEQLIKREANVFGDLT